MPKSLVWLASYPKSGNTWLRAFLANYFVESDGPVPLDKIRQVSFGDSAMEPYVHRARIDHRRLMPAQLLQLRQSWLDEISNRGAMNFVKTHNAHARLGQAWWIPAALTHSAIYLVRDPRDMVISYADHWGIPIDNAIREIANRQNMIAPNPRSVAQFLGAWSAHVDGWSRARDLRVLTVRYEDMLSAPEREFARILRHIGAPLDEATLSQAIERSSFGQLAAAEAAEGFSERGPKQQAFFRKGEAGGWRDVLTEAQATQIWSDHRAAMRRHKYTEH